ncbi:MAG: transcription factor FapR [Clostridia bacterium]|nr:transcription factor FapR [Clostridia bacterium]
MGLERPAASLSRRERQRALRETLRREPLLTDEELAERFHVSVPTIRLDRATLGLPDVRERARSLASQALGRVRALGPQEIVGEIVDVELGRHAVSILEAEASHAFERNATVRGQHLYAQAESLAMAVVDAGDAVPEVVNVKFKRPVRIGERVVAKAEILRQPRPGQWVVLVQSRVQNDIVFRGKFLVTQVAPAAGDDPAAAAIRDEHSPVQEEANR